MTGIVKSIDIHAPPGHVFHLMRDPWNTSQIWPDVIHIDDIERLSPSRWRFRWVRKVLGIRFEGMAETVEFPPDHGMMCEASGGLHHLSAWALDGAADGTTQVTLYVDWVLPVPMLHKHSKEAATAAFEADADLMLTRLKTLAETALSNGERHPTNREHQPTHA